ncbi:MAG: ABC transporter permease, partial [Bacteroidetes bacterium]
MQKILQMPRKATEEIGRSIIGITTTIGALSIFTYQFFFWHLQKPFRFKLFFNQLFFIGNKSLFIVCLSGLFTGMVMAYQTYFGFKLINVDSLVGPIVAISLAKELAPVLTGLIVAGRAGAAMAAEIGTMKVTEQIDALEVMGINGIQYLVVPRVLASFFALPMLSIMFLFVGNIGSYMIGTHVLQIDSAVYFGKLGKFMFVEDIVQGII